MGGDDGVPNLAVYDVALGQQNVAFAVVYLDDFDFDLVADIDILIDQVGLLDQAISLVTYVYANLVLGDLDNSTGNGLAGTELYQSGLNFSHEVGLLDFYLLLNVVHSCYNLLKCTIRRGSAGCNTDVILRRDFDALQFARVLDQVSSFADLPAQLVELARVGAVSSSDDQHHIRFPCNLHRFGLPLRGRRADGRALLNLNAGVRERNAHALETLRGDGRLRNYERPFGQRGKNVCFGFHRPAQPARPA